MMDSSSSSSKQTPNVKSDEYLVGCYKNKFTLEERKSIAEKVIARYPCKVPVIIEYANSFPDEYKQLSKQRYLVPKDHTVGMFMFIVRKQVLLSPNKALYFLVDNKSLIKITDIMSSVYDTYKNDDKCLYIQIAIESTFG